MSVNELSGLTDEAIAYTCCTDEVREYLTNEINLRSFLAKFEHEIRGELSVQLRKEAYGGE